MKLLLGSKRNPTRWIEAASARFDANIDIYSTPPGWQESAQRQREFISTQDAVTGRAKILYAEEASTNVGQRLRSGMTCIVHLG